MPPLTPPSRREALRLLGAGITLAAGGCSKPVEEIVPYVRAPEQLLPGVPVRYATTLSLSGWARGVHAIAVDGRPIKIEGNPLHPSSLGATDVFAEAAILDLYDPDRSRTVTERVNGIASWDMFERALSGPLSTVRGERGRGLHLVTGRVTSPTLARQIDALLQALPEAVWHVHEAIDEANAERGAELAFGRPLRALPRLDRAETILCVGADPLGAGPDQIRLARAFAERRRDPARFGRLYVAESALTLTGVKADARRAVTPLEQAAILTSVANALGAGLAVPDLPEAARRFAQAAAADLAAHQGRALVLAGPALPPEWHGLTHWINARLRAPVDVIAPPDRIEGRIPATLADLAQALDRGSVTCLAILGGDPVATAPADLDLARRIARARFSVHAGLHGDETAGATHWHLPLTHELESWSDLRATDGTVSLVQPLLRPLYDGRSLHEILPLFTGRSATSGYALVRETWRERGGADFEGWWRRCLHDGVVADSAAPIVDPGEPRLPALPEIRQAGGLTVELRPDPCLWDGRFANNAWLQECPKPISKQVWGNALALSRAEARRRGLEAGDVVRASAGGRSIEVPVIVESGVAEGVGVLTLGYGRERAGAIGNGIGANAYGLVTQASPWLVTSVDLAKSDRTETILRTQNYVEIEGETKKLFRQIDLAALASAEPKGIGADQPSLLDPWKGDADGHAWAMVIDTDACIGCNACVVACQSENNVPVVGPEEIARGRMMHWLRVDIYDEGSPEAPRAGFQPVPCMHCEHAPCEPVCPVAASVHDGEGLNLQVYNRCVGTRFCEANCPYKVRRFNFFGYADGQPYANLGAESVKAQRNPNVTVRARGVMEKCTYCIQRIATERQAAERDGREMGPVVTACQSACPTRAIRFGDLAKPGNAIAELRKDSRHYALMEELNTRPRTTYLANLRSPNPDLKEDRA
ncbi:4Fe-4S dicluster domain-containing protein [Methylorubrum extorquens]|jgi:Fe-S-cluster-containing dehydrogenase component/anaerobic selenocysteine-containing dehydrogenase|uniref:4Fe-4S dicluster domain-containing protein n=1 Tax=Methylorubrum TaxID=2282523 RepID=UPI001AE6D3D8|nr:4Fe-4S dicluster domain-containing protein [Methylorubrum sp. GM97]BDL37599.1 molybdopterin oxidoreductase [Methylorubrum sp. GM97]